MPTSERLIQMYESEHAARRAVLGTFYGPAFQGYDSRFFSRELADIVMQLHYDAWLATATDVVP